MKVFHAISDLGTVPGPVCIAIGVFDGVHLGHQAVIRRAMTEAAQIGGSAVALTFHPHPARILRPESAPHLLTSTAHKLALIERLGCPYLLQVTFDEAFAEQSPGTFIEQLASAAHPLRRICVGRDWAFGKNRSGDVDFLREAGKTLGFETLEVPSIKVAGESVSSTRIRQAVQRGDFSAARVFLGRDFTILATVRHGAGLGGKIGYPTANLASHNEQFPPNGVYAVGVKLEGEWLRGVANIGVRPTVESEGERLLEVHIFDFHEDCYGKNLEVRFEHFLRPEKKFASVEELTTQIHKDAARARSLIRHS